MSLTRETTQLGICIATYAEQLQHNSMSVGHKQAVTTSTVQPDVYSRYDRDRFFHALGQLNLLDKALILIAGVRMGTVLDMQPT